MKLAVFHDLPSGGAKRALYEYVRRLTVSHTVDVYAPVTANEDYLDLRGLKVRYTSYPFETGPSRYARRLPLVRNFAQYRILFTNLRKLHQQIAADIDTAKYDVVFVHHSQYTQSPYILNYLRTPSVYYCQEPRRRSFEYSAKQKLQARGFKERIIEAAQEPRLIREDIVSARAATHIIANSFFSVESIKRAYGRYAQVCYLGVDTSHFRPGPARRSNYIVSVGALDPVKGHQLVIESAARLAPKVRPEVVIVADRGSDHFAAELSAQAEKAAVALTLRRGVTDDELIRLYGSAQATVCAGELEPFGFTPIESMACATPVIAVREGGYKETVIDGVNGLLVERQDESIAPALSKLLSNDRAWTQLQKGCLTSAAQWNWEDATRKLEHVFESVALKVVR